MDYPPKIFEIVMLVCFGSSWPFAVAKTLRTKVVVGKSPVFLVLIFIGYLSGISYKLTVDFDHVIWLYALNGSMVLTEIVLYVKYEKQNLILQCQNVKKTITTCTFKFMPNHMPLKINE
jgi:hypothetical protein